MVRSTVLVHPSAAALSVAGLAASPVESRLGLAYGAGDELPLDLYLPPGSGGLRPGLVLVHGGGWHAGGREQFSWHAAEAARLGYIAVTVDYRLTGVAPWPACLEDCQQAVRWLRGRAGELGLDPERLGAFGSSAGGHLAACLGVRDALRDGLSSRVQCVVDVHGVHDFPSLPADKLSDVYVPLLGGSLDERRQVWEDASPQAFVNDEAAATLLVHDPGDPVVPYEQSVEFATALMRAGRPTQLLPTPGSGHGFVYGPANTWTQRVWPVAVEWLGRFLQP